MDGMIEFSILTLFGVLSTDPPECGDRSFVGVVKFYITLPTAILATIAIWTLIARIGSRIFIPIDLGLGVVLTLISILALFIAMYILISRGADTIEKYIRSALKERHDKHEYEARYFSTRHMIRY